MKKKLKEMAAQLESTKKANLKIMSNYMKEETVRLVNQK